jgi:CcmD family protein
MHLLIRSLIAMLFVTVPAVAAVGVQERSPAFPPPPPPPLIAPSERASPVSNQPGGAAQKPQDEFRPISELPPEDRLPAAPMLVTAYIFVVLALFAYVLSLSRRLSSVAKELSRLDSELKRSGRT